MHNRIRSRRVAALARLEEQLRKGHKNVRAGFDGNTPIHSIEELSEKDIKRINKEIEILKSKT